MSDSDRLTVLLIPSDPRISVCHLNIDVSQDHGFGQMQKLVGGYVEIVRGLRIDQTPLVVSGEPVLVVNEEGHLRRLEPNPRASFLYPHDIVIAGDALLTCESPDREKFISLPGEIADWGGPGVPLPSAISRDSM